MTRQNKYISLAIALLLFLVAGWICKISFFPGSELKSPVQALDSGDPVVLEASFSKAIDPNQASALNKRTFAHYLILKGSAQQLRFFAEALKIFLRHGGDINRQDIYGMTALHYAYKYDVPQESIALLLASGANESLKDKEGRTPKMRAKPVFNRGY